MASELINQIKKLQTLIIKRNNEEFKKNAVELLAPSKADEDLFVAPAMAFPDDVDEPEEADNQAETPQEVPVEEPPLPEPETVHTTMEIESAIRMSIAEEYQAAAVYIKRASEAYMHGQDKLARLFEELAGDEIVHAASLETALDMYNMFDPYKFLQGQAEAEHILQEDAKDIAKQEEKARENAEKEKKEFDFAKEYTKNKAEYEREQIINAINDVILGQGAVDDIVDTVLKVAKGAKKDKKKDKKAE